MKLTSQMPSSTSELLTGEHGGDVDLLSCHTDAAAGGDEDIPVVEGIFHFRQAVISARIDDPKLGVSQGDVYQMMAYAHLYKAPKLTLLYPHHDGLVD